MELTSALVSRPSNVFAGLFAAGLVESGSQVCGETFSQFLDSGHEVVLSEKGRLLSGSVEGCDEERYRAALGPAAQTR